MGLNVQASSAGQPPAGAGRQRCAGSVPRRHDLVARTRAAIEALLPYECASLARAAGCLQMHRSTLKRRLGRQGVNFRELRDEVRFQLAVKYLADVGMPMAQIGMLLGFAEENSFFRAFKRWTGSTPGAYRRGEAGKGLAAMVP